MAAGRGGRRVCPRHRHRAAAGGDCGGGDGAARGGVAQPAPVRAVNKACRGRKRALGQGRESFFANCCADDDDDDDNDEDIIVMT